MTAPPGSVRAGLFAVLTPGPGLIGLSPPSDRTSLPFRPRRRLRWNRPHGPEAHLAHLGGRADRRAAPLPRGRGADLADRVPDPRREHRRRLPRRRPERARRPPGPGQVDDGPADVPQRRGRRLLGRDVLLRARGGGAAPAADLARGRPDVRQQRSAHLPDPRGLRRQGRAGRPARAAAGQRRSDGPRRADGDRPVLRPAGDPPVDLGPHRPGRDHRLRQGGVRRHRAAAADRRRLPPEGEARSTASLPRSSRSP